MRLCTDLNHWLLSCCKSHRGATCRRCSRSPENVRSLGAPRRRPGAPNRRRLTGRRSPRCGAGAAGSGRARRPAVARRCDAVRRRTEPVSEIRRPGADRAQRARARSRHARSPTSSRCRAPAPSSASCRCVSSIRCLKPPSGNAPIAPVVARQRHLHRSGAAGRIVRVRHARHAPARSARAAAERPRQRRACASWARAGRRAAPLDPTAPANIFDQVLWSMLKEDWGDHWVSTAPRVH